MGTATSTVCYNPDMMGCITSYLSDARSVRLANKGVRAAVKADVTEEVYRRNLSLLEEQCPQIYGQIPLVYTNVGKTAYFYRVLRPEQQARIEMVADHEVIVPAGLGRDAGDDIRQFIVREKELRLLQRLNSNWSHIQIGSHLTAAPFIIAGIFLYVNSTALKIRSMDDWIKCYYDNYVNSRNAECLSPWTDYLAEKMRGLMWDAFKMGAISYAGQTIHHLATEYGPFGLKVGLHKTEKKISQIVSAAKENFSNTCYRVCCYFQGI
jgi:hypothetical protein